MSDPDRPVTKLPVVSSDDSEKVWFTAEQMVALRASRMPFYAQNWGIIGFALLFFSITILHVNPFGVVSAYAMYIIGGALLATLVLTLLAINELESGRHAKSLWLCKVGLFLGRCTGTFWFSEVLLEQVRSIVFSRQGRLVEAQIAFARWPLSSSRTFGDTTLAGIMVRGLCFEGAAALYRRRYEQVQAESNNAAGAILVANLGFAYLLLGQAETSKKYSEEALKLSSMGSFEQKANILTNLAQANLLLEELAEAEEQLNRVLEMMSGRSKYMGQLIGEVQLGFAELRLLQNRLDEALLHATSSTEYFQSVGKGAPLRQYALKVHAQILQVLGRDEEAKKVTEKFNADQLTRRIENDVLFERASKILDKGKSPEMRRLAMGDF